MEKCIHRFEWNSLNKTFEVRSKADVPSDLFEVSSTIHSTLASQSGINRMNPGILIMLIMVCVCSGLAAGFVAIIYRVQIVGIVCLVATPFGAYLVVSMFASQKRRLNMIHKYLELNTAKFETQAWEYGYHVNFRIGDGTADYCDHPHEKPCLRLGERICFIVEYSLYPDSSRPKSCQTKGASSGRRENHTTIKEIEPEAMAQEQELEQKESIDHEQDQRGTDGVSKAASSYPKRISQCHEEELATDRKPLVLCVETDGYLRPRKEQVPEDATKHPRLVAQVRFKDISRRSFSQGVFVVANVSHANEIVKIRPKNLAPGKKSPILVSKRISGLEYDQSRGHESKHTLRGVNVVTPNKFRLHSKPRIKTLVASGRDC